MNAILLACAVVSAPPVAVTGAGPDTVTVTISGATPLWMNGTHVLSRVSPADSLHQVTWQRTWTGVGKTYLSVVLWTGSGGAGAGQTFVEVVYSVGPAEAEQLAHWRRVAGPAPLPKSFGSIGSIPIYRFDDTAGVNCSSASCSVSAN